MLQCPELSISQVALIHTAEYLIFEYKELKTIPYIKKNSRRKSYLYGYPDGKNLLRNDSTTFCIIGLESLAIVTYHPIPISEKHGKKYLRFT